MQKLDIKLIHIFPIKIQSHLSTFIMNLISIMMKLKLKLIIKLLIILKMILKFKEKFGMQSTTQIDHTREESLVLILILIPMDLLNLNYKIQDSKEGLKMISFTLLPTKIDSQLTLLSTPILILNTLNNGKNKED